MITAGPAAWSALHEDLLRAFPGSAVNVVDRTALHLGHDSHPHGFHHLEIQVISPAFCNMPLLERHQRIYRAIGPLADRRLHALQIQASAPGESPLPHPSPSSI
jgi:BolA protein